MQRGKNARASQCLWDVKPIIMDYTHFPSMPLLFSSSDLISLKSVTFLSPSPNVCFSVSTTMTFIQSAAATVEVSLTLVPLNAKRTEAHTETQIHANTKPRLQSVHSAAVNTGRYVSPCCGVLIINHYNLTPSPSPPPVFSQLSIFNLLPPCENS